MTHTLLHHSTKANLPYKSTFSPYPSTLPSHPNPPSLPNKRSCPVYHNLLAYKITVPIYDLTVEFTTTYISKFSRTTDQMIQAARSGMQNIAEGNKQESLKGYIQLAGVARGSLEELLNDYLAYARQNKIEVWEAEKAKREIREISEIWAILKSSPTLSSSPNFPSLSNHPTKAVNLMLTLTSQANFLLDKLTASLKDIHKTEGGLTEKLYRDRINYRKNNPNKPLSPKSP